MFLVLALVGACNVRNPPAVLFVCGDSTCDSSIEYCYSLTGGAQPESGEAYQSSSCEAFPEACLDDPSCACLEAQGAVPGGDCQEDPGGGIFVHVYAP